MKKDIIIEAVSNIDDDVIKLGLDTREKMISKLNKKKKYIRQLKPIAACILLFMVLLTPTALKNKKRPVLEDPKKLLTIDATKNPEGFSGLPYLYIIGSTSTGPNTAPPRFYFDVSGFIINAKVIRNLPDTYCLLTGNIKYRIIQMQVIEVVRGSEFPNEFYYLLPEKAYVDMSVYDTLVISMKQLGGDNYTLKNVTQGKMETFSSVFSDYIARPELGNVIAFTDDIFDESLWQNESWIFGYQFGRRRLDEADSRETDLVVKRGCTLSETIDNIHEQMNLYEIPEIPNVVKFDFKNEKAREVYEYVSSFTNGVFLQSLYKYNNDDIITFNRYINGCRTNEWVKININTEEVTYSDQKFTQEDMINLPDVVSYIQDFADQYRLEKPSPPHLDTNGKSLISLYLYGWYVKTDDNIYCIIKTVWKYSDEEDKYLEYYDDSYIICNAEDNTMVNISRDELLDIIGYDIDVYQGKYGDNFYMPIA